MVGIHTCAQLPEKIVKISRRGVRGGGSVTSPPGMGHIQTRREHRAARARAQRAVHCEGRAFLLRRGVERELAPPRCRRCQLGG